MTWQEPPLVYLIPHPAGGPLFVRTAPSWIFPLLEAHPLSEWRQILRRRDYRPRPLILPDQADGAEAWQALPKRTRRRPPSDQMLLFAEWTPAKPKRTRAPKAAPAAAAS